MRDETNTDEWLKRAAAHDEEIRTARLMTEAELAVNARRFDAALEALEALRESGQRHVAAQRLSLRVYRGVGRWDDVLRVARQLEKHRALTREAAAELKLRAHLENLRGKEGDAGALISCWQAMPKDERCMPRLAAATARALIAAGDAASAQRIIEAQIEIEWDSELAELYGDCNAGEVMGRLARAEKWLEQQPQDARLLLTLGRLCREQQLWGKAQSYFEAAIALQPNQHNYAELAALLDQLGREEEANRAYRKVAMLCEKCECSNRVIQN
jgi:HemY protein